MRYVLNAVYLILVLVFSPWLLYAVLFQGKYRQGWAQKGWGQVPLRTQPGPCVWLHAVSVGEVNLLEPLLKRIAQQHPDWQCVISTTTRTGYELACRKYANYTVFYCPLDFSWAVTRALQRIQPDLLVLAELELWPNLIREAQRRGTRVAIVNGRLSEKSFRGYSRVVRWIRPLLGQIDWIAAQTDDYAIRFRTLGAPAERIAVTGSMKFDGASSTRDNPRTRSLAAWAAIEPDDVVFLAGSTQHPEEQLALQTYRQLQACWPRLRLVLAPRHAERFEEVAQLLAQSGLPWTRRSQLRPGQRAERVLLVDTIGELGAWWGVAQIGFVGGSLGKRGGQNMIEPAAYGTAVSFGPNTRNFRDVVSLLLQAEAAQVVHSGPELTAFVENCLSDPESARQMGTRAQQLVRKQVGAADRTLLGLEKLMADRRTTGRIAAPHHLAIFRQQHAQAAPKP